MRRRSLAALGTLACLAFTTCSSGSPGAPLALPRSPAALPHSRSSHFIAIVLENRELGEAIGQRSAPYIQRLAREGALATDYHAIAHPSLPNYIALLAGSPLGIQSDCSGCHARGTMLADQLERAHIGWRAYMESMPRPCFAGASAAGYAKKHDPFMYFGQVAANPTACARVVPYAQLAQDLRGGRLAPFVWITPNLCDDGHDCSLAAVNHFLEGLLPYLRTALGSHGVLAIVWDEGTSESRCCGNAAGGRVPLLLVGPGVRASYRLSSPASHYSLLALIEDYFGVARLREAACPCTPSLDAAFEGGAPPRFRR